MSDSVMKRFTAHPDIDLRDNGIYPAWLEKLPTNAHVLAFQCIDMGDLFPLREETEYNSSLGSLPGLEEGLHPLVLIRSLGVIVGDSVALIVLGAPKGHSIFIFHYRDQDDYNILYYTGMRPTGFVYENWILTLGSLLKE